MDRHNAGSRAKKITNSDSATASTISNIKINSEEGVQRAFVTFKGDPDFLCWLATGKKVHEYSLAEDVSAWWAFDGYPWYAFLFPDQFNPQDTTGNNNAAVEMTEPRARAARHKGQLNFQDELRQFLYAFGDDKEPLAETIRVLDEIVTDYVIETCHTAAKSAEVAGRQKIKVDDFKFAIRKDEVGTGRVKELLQMEKVLKDQRKQFDTEEGRVGLERGGRKKKEDGKEELKEEGKDEAKGKGKGKEAKLGVEMEVDEDMGVEEEDDDAE
ncbi:Transcription initiation factor TFIID subunit 13 [Mycoblastus sanguinarius]|nr:Transcription initiation factor TFIID subunit 13 [Mycoblastus sanguinarius]